MLCHHLRDICNRIVHDLDLHLQSRPRLNVDISIKSPYVTFYVNNNICLICHCLRGIHNHNVHDLDF